jgi:hypothetical protein
MPGMPAYFLCLLLLKSNHEPRGRRRILHGTKLFLQQLEHFGVSPRRRFRPEPFEELAGVAELLDADAQAMRRFGIERANMASHLADLPVARVEHPDSEIWIGMPGAADSPRRAGRSAWRSSLESRDLVTTWRAGCGLLCSLSFGNTRR